MLHRTGLPPEHSTPFRQSEAVSLQYAVVFHQSLAAVVYTFNVFLFLFFALIPARRELGADGELHVSDGRLRESSPDGGVSDR